MKHPASRLLFSYWDRLRGERTAPERGEVDPVAIRDILADTFILELETVQSVHFRLAGTRLSALYGRDLKGTAFPDLWPAASQREAFLLAETVLAEMAPVVAGLSAVTQNADRHDLELLLLPLRHRGKTHARMLGCLTAEAPLPWVGLDPVRAQALSTMRVIRGSAAPPEALASGRKPAPPVREPRRRAHLWVFEGGRSTEPDAWSPGAR